MEPQEDDYVITDARSGGYMLFTSGHYSDKSLGKYRTRDAAFSAARRRMEKEGFYTDVYYMNERGTVDLLDENGDFSRENPMPSTLTLGLIAAGVVAFLGVVIYKTGVLKAGPWTPGPTYPGSSDPPGSLTCGPTPALQTPCTPQQAAINPMVDWTGNSAGG